MTGEEVQVNSSKNICPYYRVGYCKYKNKCKLFHPKENCGDRKCRDKACTKRHRKPCKYGQTCSRKCWLCAAGTLSISLYSCVFVVDQYIYMQPFQVLNWVVTGKNGWKSMNAGGGAPQLYKLTRRLARYACFFWRGSKMWRTDKRP